MTCWGITDGTSGTMAQVKALAAAIGVQPVMKKIIIKRPFVWLPNAFYGKWLQQKLPTFIHSWSDTLLPPWPDIVISCGRRGALAALALKRLVDGNVRFIHIQDPQMKAENFDLIVAMQHDRIEGANVIKTKFALHNITPALLAEATTKFAKRFSVYPKPYIAVLVGGSTNKYTLKSESMKDIIIALQQLANNITGTLLVTTSRRTGSDNLQLMLDAFPRSRDGRIYVYDGVGDNPYLGMLALAEHIVVTNDSVNMMSEAVATGKPVYILKLSGHKDTKPSRFAEQLIADGIARPFSQALDKWNYSAVDEMSKVAEDIKQRLVA